MDICISRCIITDQSPVLLLVIAFFLALDSLLNAYCLVPICICICVSASVFSCVCKRARVVCLACVCVRALIPCARSGERPSAYSSRRHLWIWISSSVVFSAHEPLCEREGRHISILAAAGHICWGGHAFCTWFPSLPCRSSILTSMISCCKISCWHETL